MTFCPQSTGEHSVTTGTCLIDCTSLTEVPGSQAECPAQDKSQQIPVKVLVVVKPIRKINRRKY